MMVLLCCFVFAFFRIKIVLSLTRALGDGLSYLDMRNDGTMFCQSFMRRLISLRRGKKRVRKYSYSVTDRMMRAIRTFVIATSVLNTLPELSALSYLPGDDTVFQLYDYIALLRGFSMMVSLIFGVVFVCRVLRFTRDIGTDLAYYARLQACVISKIGADIAGKAQDAADEHHTKDQGDHHAESTKQGDIVIQLEHGVIPRKVRQRRKLRQSVQYRGGDHKGANGTHHAIGHTVRIFTHTLFPTAKGDQPTHKRLTEHRTIVTHIKIGQSVAQCAGQRKNDLDAEECEHKAAKQHHHRLLLRRFG